MAAAPVSVNGHHFAPLRSAVWDLSARIIASAFDGRWSSAVVQKEIPFESSIGG
jgi:hypothetical protein